MTKDEETLAKSFVPLLDNFIPISLKQRQIKDQFKKKTKDDIPKRGTWSSKAEFVLSCIGMSVGMANVWRFPYIAYENGGGSFQIPYLILLLTVGIPTYLMEAARGQFSQLGPIAVWRCCPVAVGVGWAMMAVTVIGMSYYNILIAYTLFYMASSFVAELPWKQCQRWWGADDNCYIRTTTTSSNWSLAENISEINQTSFQTSTQQYWEKHVLDIGSSDGISFIGSIQWKLAAGLAFAWLCVFLCLFKGVRSAGKAVYVTATVPYVILVAFLIQGLMLPGSSMGIKYFLLPQWEKLLDLNVWTNATRQMVYSLGMSNGALITLASYNKFHNKCHWDAFHVGLLDFLTSFIASIVIFAVLGALATDLNKPISSIFGGGQGLAFIIFPEVVLRLPLPQLWCFLFFFMLFTLGIDSQFASFESMWTAVFDEFPKLRRYQTLLYFTSILAAITIGIVYTTSGGQYILTLVDSYSQISRTLVLACEVIAIMWIYGLERFCDDLQMMFGFKINIYLKICWKYISPATIIMLTVVSWYKFNVPRYGSYQFPFWAHLLGFSIASIPILLIFVGAGVVLRRHFKKGDIGGAFRPLAEWGPGDSEAFEKYHQHYNNIPNKKPLEVSTHF